MDIGLADKENANLADLDGVWRDMICYSCGGQGHGSWQSIKGDKGQGQRSARTASVEQLQRLRRDERLWRERPASPRKEFIIHKAPKVRKAAAKARGTR